MKLRTQTIIGVCLIWIGCLLLIFWAGMTEHIISSLLLGMILGLLLLWLINSLIFKKLEKLRANIAKTNAQNEFIQRLSDVEPDEFADIVRQFNQTLDLLEASNKKFEISTQMRESPLEAHESSSDQLVKLGRYDTLTSLPNRVFFNEMLNKTINHANRHKKMMGILFIDLDRFKSINEALGHSNGDLVLKEVANRFATVLRAGDILARLGGDEFIILLNDIKHAKFASPVAKKILQVCAEPIETNHQKFSITASIGISIYPDDGTSLEDLQRNADTAMYKAKRAGGGIFQYFMPEMNLEAHEHIQKEAALRKAISNNEFILYYQPKLDLKNGNIVGVEALIRWEHPDLGIIDPTRFIPLAEETGLIMEIGEWALREACRTNKAWQTAGYQPISVSVNLSPKQFRHPDIAELVANVLQETGLNPVYLELEITETAVMDNIELAIKKLNEIKQMGVFISVDDFGTGYTSINYLKKLPVSVLKIDQSFIKDIPSNQNNTAITSAVIALAHILGMKVVAEGVENAEQLLYLTNHQSDLVQGYYLSRPLPEKKIVLQFTQTLF